jgi:hypothetical protein
MSRNWEDTFRSWAKPPSETEQEKCDNAERAIRQAIRKSSSLDHRKINVFPQGSYRNRTNVRLDSDVDICILCTDSFSYDLPNGMTPGNFGITPATYWYPEYKNDVEDSLVSHFGRNSVKRGNKAFDVHENTYRIDADVVPCFEYHWYNPNGTYLKGTMLHTDDGKRIINWPEQNYDNGVAKNRTTYNRFKSVVRILKRLRNEMTDNGFKVSESIPSYLIECLVWNVPDKGFGHDAYTDDVRDVLAYLFNNTLDFQKCNEWCEINCIKYLFHIFQPWNYQQVNKFLNITWEYIGLE